MLDVVIQNARIIDGTGAPARRGSVGIRGGKLVLPVREEAAQTIDAQGKILCPGFIDSHSHTDRFIGSDPEMIGLCKISQGITTEVCGQCGSSTFPVPEGCGERMRNYFVEDMNPEQLQNIVRFRDFSTYLQFVREQKRPGNFAFLVGHSTLRLAAMGYENRRPTAAEMETMKACLREAMEHGCFGMSTGLIYVPGVYADTQELIELCRTMQPYGGIYATHLRSESDHVVDAVKEAIFIAEQAGVPLFLSHHKVCGVRNWGASRETLRLVREAVARGVRITLDQYPYVASQTGLCQCMPPKYFTNGAAAAAALLKDPAMRDKIRAEMTQVPCSYNSSYQNANGFSGILILSAPNTPQAEGMTVAQWAAHCGKEEFTAYFDLMEENEGKGSGAFFCMDEKELDSIYLYENTVVGTDGLVGKKDGPTHPRAYGSLVRAICLFAKQKKLLPLEQAVRKQTSLTAERWGLYGKGRIADGYDADLVLLDYDQLADKADFLHPRALCEGILCVWVNGKISYRGGKITDAYPGGILLHRPEARA